MRGVSAPIHEYARVADAYIQNLSIHPSSRDPAVMEAARNFTSSTRAYTRVVLRLRLQAEKESDTRTSHSGPPPSRGNGQPATSRSTPSRASSRAGSPTFSSFSHSHHGPTINPPRPATPSNGFRSPLFRLRRAPLLRVFVPSPEGDWLSDRSVLECEAELKRAGILHLLRMGDVVWDVAVGDEGNVGRLVWDGSYLIVRFSILTSPPPSSEAFTIGS